MCWWRRDVVCTIALPPTEFNVVPAALGDTDHPRMLHEPRDMIAPRAIEHLHEQVLDFANREQLCSYNYLDYHFDTAVGACRARTYDDTIDEVAFYPPRGIDVEHGESLRVLHYLAQRFRTVEVLCKEGYEPWRFDAAGPDDATGRSDQ
jgi:hypothetical protein